MLAMYRSYQPILPSHNRFLQLKWDSKYYDEHRKKVREAVPIVDTKAPASFIHLHQRLKKIQIEEERLSTIERDNMILLERMSSIMRNGGQVNNRNLYTNKSLNREKRERELLRVTKENHMILYRINMRKPEYSNLQWQQDWERNQKFMDNISAYPIDWWLKERKSARSVRSCKSSSSRRQDEQTKEIKSEENKEAEDQQTSDRQRKESGKDKQRKKGGSGRKEKDEKRHNKDDKSKNKEMSKKKQVEVAVEDDDEDEKKKS